MGIPSYFSHIVKNHSQIIKKYSIFLQYNKINNLYLDSNSIIYDSYRIMLETHSLLTKTKFENKLIEHICKQLKLIIQFLLRLMALRLWLKWNNKEVEDINLTLKKKLFHK